MPHKLSGQSPLASGEGQEARAELVRALLRRGADQAFSSDDDDAFLRHRVLDLGYLDAAPRHESRRRELALSSSAYFRRLRIATDRVADYVVSARAGETVTTPR